MARIGLEYYIKSHKLSLRFNTVKSENDSVVLVLTSSVITNS